MTPAGGIADELRELNRLLQEPARLAIMTVLENCRSADFLSLQTLTGLTKGNLSVHLHKLEEAGMLQVKKSFIQRKPHTLLVLTADGRRQIAAHWKQLESLRRAAGDLPK